MMIVFPLLFTLLLAVFGGAEDHKKCERNVCEVFQFLQTESNDRMESCHKALRKVIEDLGASIHIKDDMPLQTCFIRYQKLLHDKAERRFKQLLHYEAIHIDQLINDLEKDLEIKLQKEKTNSVSLSNHMMNEIIKLSTIINSKEANMMEKIDSVQDRVQESVTQSSIDLFHDLKQAFMNITHTIVLEALQPLMTRNEILDQKITDIQINMTRNIEPYDCSDIRKLGERRSGVYSIYPQGEAVSVYCDMTTDGGGWTVFLKRHKQPIQENFHRNWTDYRNGFGTPPNEYWLGNEILYRMTNQRDYSMRTDAVGLGTPAKVWGEYSQFLIASETLKYRLSISGRNAGDTMDIVHSGFLYNDDQYFSSYERDNDRHGGGNCAELFGGFWHKICSHHYPTKPYEDMEFWYWSKVDKNERRPTSVQMKIRPRNWRE